MMNKLVLRQVPPERQGEWLIDELRAMEGFAIYGNRDFKGIDNLNTYGLFEDGKFTNFENMLEDYEYVEKGYESYEDLESELDQVTADYINTKLTGEQIKAIRNVITEDFEGCWTFDYYWTDERFTECITKIIYIIDGRKLELDTIRGGIQGDWQSIIYDPEMVDIQEIEAYYFNTGTEWEVGYVEYEDDETIDFETVELDFGTQYTTEWSCDEIKKQFDDCYNIYEEDVIMLGFDGYVKTPKYKAL